VGEGRLVGEEVVALPREINSLRKGAGENGSLKPKGNFEPSPHRVAALEAAEIGASSIGDDRYLVAGRFILDAVSGQWRDKWSDDRGSSIRSLIAAFEDVEFAMAYKTGG
jgi:hypothetical protein